MSVVQVALVSFVLFLQFLDLFSLLLYFISHGFVFSLKERLRAFQRLLLVRLSPQLVVKLPRFILDTLSLLLAVLDECLRLNKQHLRLSLLLLCALSFHLFLLH